MVQNGLGLAQVGSQAEAHFLNSSCGAIAESVWICKEGLIQIFKNIIIENNKYIINNTLVINKIEK